jgi:hypothetical protein
VDLKRAEARIQKAIRHYQQGIILQQELANNLFNIICIEYPEGYEPRGLPEEILRLLPPLHSIRRVHRNPMINLAVKFTKTGRDIKAAAAALVRQLKERLDRRNIALEEFIKDRSLLRSYLIRSSKASWGHGGFIWPKDAIASERLEEVRQMCERIYDIEQDIQRLQMLIAHLEDDKTFELTYDELVSYGFQPGV